MNDLLTPDQLADEWGIPVQTLAQWRYLGKGPAFVRLGRKIRYRRPDLNAYLESQRRTRTDVRAEPVSA